ncbi:MAG: flavin reductase [Thermosipho sp. (in: Bacteria)]|nr:flavin reductase [Thermosipho sp. (in: thermotogales)]
METLIFLFVLVYNKCRQFGLLTILRGCDYMFQEALDKISYGLYIVTSRDSEKLNGQIVDALMQTAAIPPAVSISINKNNLTHELIMKSKVFGVTVLSEETPMIFIGRFGFKSGRDIDKFEGINYEIGKTGTPLVLEYAVSVFEAEVVDYVDSFTHTIFVGKIVDTKVVSDKRPMTYLYYREVVKGKSPKNAPTYKGK